MGKGGGLYIRDTSRLSRCFVVQIFVLVATKQGYHSQVIRSVETNLGSHISGSAGHREQVIATPVHIFRVEFFYQP